MIAAKVLRFASKDSVNNYTYILTKPLAPKVSKLVHCYFEVYQKHNEFFQLHY